jgi:hypothetical protein
MRENQLTLLLNRPWIEGPQIVGRHCEIREALDALDGAAVRSEV